MEVICMDTVTVAMAQGEAPGEAARVMDGYASHLRNGEKSAATVEKYVRYARAFLGSAGGGEVCRLTREGAVEWKRAVAARYTAAGANGMIAAANSFAAYLGRPELRLGSLRVQRQMLVPQERELGRGEQRKLVEAARRLGRARLALAMRTMAGTGIRVSELAYITVEAARSGRADVSLKGKTRTVILHDKLRPQLLEYARAQGIEAGPIFITRTGRPVDRHSVWRGMKGLCKAAGVLAGKVFPHNLRRLFARTFYQNIPNLCDLADAMGHSNVNTTRLYTSGTAAQLRRKLTALDL
jgi:integrase